MNATSVERTKLSKGFGVRSEWPAIFNAYCDLNDEYVSLVQEIESITDNSSKKELFLKNLPDIFNSLKSFTFTVSTDQGYYNISPSSSTALRFIAADLPQDKSATAEDINKIRQLIIDLQAEIEASTTFSKQMRGWLLDLVRVIRDSIDRYANRGSRGMRKQFSQLLGELLQSYDQAKEVQTEAPSIWTKIVDAIDLMNKIASLAEKCKPAISFGKNVLPFVKALGLPGPADEAL